MSLQIFATEVKPTKVTPPIVFTKAEFINSSTTRIPFKVIDQLIVVEVEIMNKEGNFIIDTGSEALILNSVHFQPTRKYRNDGKQKSGVHNDINQIKEKHLDELSIQDLSLEKNAKDAPQNLLHGSA